MALVEMLMPKMGESVMEGTILNWLKQPGDTIEEDESVLEVATDKVDTEIPAIESGILKEILAEVGEVVQVGQPIAIINTEAEQTESISTNDALSQTPEPVIVPAETVQPTVQSNVLISSTTAIPESNRFYSPLVLNIARKEHISRTELDTIPGSGKDGRLTKSDLFKYIDQKKEGKISTSHPSPPIPAPSQPQITPQPTPVPETAPSPPPASQSTSVASTTSTFTDEAEIIQMDRMRKMIAERMLESKRTSAHVTSFVEADVTNIVNWRKKIIQEFRTKEGINLTYTAIFMMSVAKALRDFPMVNSSVDGDKILLKKEINLGLAVALPSGNLIVPVIRNADRLNLTGMAHAIQDLAERARKNTLRPDELQGGTYTVSNIGSFGNMLGTPIIMQPQTAILSLGTVKKKPAVIETEQGDFIAIRHLMFLSHSYDHRIIDGALGGNFVRKVADYLEAFDINTPI